MCFEREKERERERQMGRFIQICIEIRSFILLFVCFTVVVKS